jgi:hypothetical protein
MKEWIGPLLLVGGVVGVLAIAGSSKTAPGQQPAPSNAGPPALEAEMQQLLAAAQADPHSVDPVKMRAVADELDAAGLHDQATTLRTAADAAAAAQQTGPLTVPFTTTPNPQNMPQGFPGRGPGRGPGPGAPPSMGIPPSPPSMTPITPGTNVRVPRPMNFPF